MGIQLAEMKLSRQHWNCNFTQLGTILDSINRPFKKCATFYLLLCNLCFPLWIMFLSIQLDPSFVTTAKICSTYHFSIRALVKVEKSRNIFGIWFLMITKSLDVVRVWLGFSLVEIIFDYGYTGAKSRNNLSKVDTSYIIISCFHET